MDIKQARARFSSQKRGAARRGVGWELTFQQWLDWWGEDLDRRGPGIDQLQMQRKLDTGPYALGNISKGHPKQNSRTHFAMERNRKADAAKRAHQAALDAAPVVADITPDSEDESISEYMSRDAFENDRRLQW